MHAGFGLGTAYFGEVVAVYSALGAHHVGHAGSALLLALGGNEQGLLHLLVGGLLFLLNVLKFLNALLLHPFEHLGLVLKLVDHVLLLVNLGSKVIFELLLL